MRGEWGGWDDLFCHFCEPVGPDSWLLSEAASHSREWGELWARACVCQTINSPPPLTPPHNTKQGERGEEQSEVNREQWAKIRALRSWICHLRNVIKKIMQGSVQWFIGNKMHLKFSDRIQYNGNQRLLDAIEPTFLTGMKLKTYLHCSEESICLSDFETHSRVTDIWCLPSFWNTVRLGLFEQKAAFFVCLVNHRPDSLH